MQRYSSIRTFCTVVLYIGIDLCLSAFGCEIGEKTCLGGKCYDPYTQACCGERVYDKNDVWNCCYIHATGQFVEYNTEYKICCGDQLHDISTKYNHTCCGGEVRLRSTGVCCMGSWHPQTGDNIRCCGDKWYDTGLHECCGKHPKHKTVHPRNSATACCGQKVYNRDTHRCDVRKRIRDKYEATCGTQLYRTSQQICCNDQVLDSPSSTHECCGSKPYHPQVELCCVSPDGKSTEVWDDAVNRKCCGTNYVDTERQICCNHTLVDKKAGLTECCGDSLHNPATSLCCQGQIHSLANGSHQECCGDKVYNTQQFQCLQGKVVPQTVRTCGNHDTNCMCSGEEIGETKLCCQANVVVKSDPQDNTCCLDRTATPQKFTTYDDRDTKVKNRCSAGKHLCNGQHYNPRFKVCCKDGPRIRVLYKCCGEKSYIKAATRTCVGGEVIDKNRDMKDNDVKPPPTKKPKRCQPMQCSVKGQTEIQQQFSNHRTVFTGKILEVNEWRKMINVQVKIEVLKGGTNIDSPQRIEISIPKKCRPGCSLHKGAKFVYMSQKFGKTGLKKLKKFRGKACFAGIIQKDRHVLKSIAKKWRRTSPKQRRRHKNKKS